MGIRGGKMMGGILRGYGRLFSSLALWGLSSLAVLALAAAIVWPLWNLATTWRGVYNLAFAAVLAAGAVSLMVGALRRRRASGEKTAAILGSWALGLLRASSFAAIALLSWLAFLLLSHPVHGWSIAAGIASVLAVLGLSGWLFQGRGRRG